MSRKISACLMAILLSASGVIGQSTFASIVGVVKDRFLLSAVYDVPVGQNRKFLSHMNRISDLAFGGWSMSTVSLWETGPYLTPTTSSSFDAGNLNLSYRGSLQRPDCIGNGNIANPASASMFNMAAFNAIPAGAGGKLWCRNPGGTWHRYDRGWVV